MPLLPGSSHDAMSSNYKELISTGRRPDVARAIMLSKAYGPKKKSKRSEAASNIFRGTRA